MDNKKNLHPFEYVGAYKLWKEERFLLADDMGMFKTAQSIFANNKFRENRKNLKTLIVCPTSVREHWARELQNWAYPKGNINLIYSGNLASGIASIKDSDWTITSYPLISQIENGLLEKLKNSGFNHVIADEVHNAKNPNVLRTKALKTIADKSEYLSLLSGTPIPNTISDLYVLMSMLDPEKYPFDPEASDENNIQSARQSFIQLYIERPQAVKELLHQKMLRRKSEDYLGSQIPHMNLQRIEVPLSGKHLETYQEIVAKEMNAGRKMMDLAKASLDPYLINPELKKMNGRDISDKYNVLDNIIMEETSKKNGKVLVFSNLKNGVIDYLTEKYCNLGAINITGDVPTDTGVREELRQKFQHDPKTKVLFATTTMNEGVDLTAATAIVDLTLPYTPAERHQRWKRSARPGEIKKDKVDVYTLFSTIPGPQESLDRALLNMVDGKEKIADYLLKGMQVSIEELKSYDETGKVPRIVKAVQSPNKAILQEYIRWRGIGSENAKKRMRKNPEVAKYIAELYPTFNMTKSSAEIYIPLIKNLEKNGRLETKVDIACGPGSLGIYLNEPTIGIDINPYMLETGRKIFPQNILYEGTMDCLPLENSVADLTLCSLAFQMSEPSKERAKSLQEMSRVLRKNGYSIITIPKDYMNEEERENFGKVLNDYGMEIKDFKKEVGKSQIDVYVLQKTHEPITNELYNLKWQGDPRFVK